MKNIPPSRKRILRNWALGDNPYELRTNSILKDSTSLLDLASNDYLGLSRHSKLIEAAQSSIHLDGVGAGGSRLVTGSRPIHEELEEALAKWLNREKVLLFPSGFQANIAAVMALATRKTLIFADRFIHHSLLVGIKASGAKLHRFHHNDLNDLERLLKRSQAEPSKPSSIVITESLFSMEGTSPNIKGITYLCEKYGAKLLIDEAHALGIMGPQGKGLGYEFNEAVSIISGTFGKAFGSGGAFLASNAQIGEKLLQTSGAFKYTTALAPSLTAAALAALNLIKSNPSWGANLLQESKIWRNQIAKSGWAKPPGCGPILSLIIGSDSDAIKKQNQLEAAGLLIIAIRPPTIPEGTSRLRLVVRKDLPKNTLDKVLNTLNQR